jgi:hypothetical protein
MILFFAIVTHIRAFGRIFTNDPAFLDLFESSRWPFTVTLVLMNAAIAIEKIPYSMGRTTGSLLVWVDCKLGRSGPWCYDLDQILEERFDWFVLGYGVWILHVMHLVRVHCLYVGLEEIRIVGATAI